MNGFGEGEISYSLVNGERGKGYGSLLLSEIVVLFANEKEHKVNCLTGSKILNNIASQKAFLKQILSKERQKTIGSIHMSLCDRISVDLIKQKFTEYYWCNEFRIIKKSKKFPQKKRISIVINKNQLNF